MIKILFQGDSITDSNRAKDEKWAEKYQGSGYPVLVAAELGYRHPEKYCFMNRGISGNRVVDLLARVKCDLINLKPDVVSILIGVNDAWHDFGENPNGVDAEKFFKIYSLAAFPRSLSMVNLLFFKRTDIQCIIQKSSPFKSIRSAHLQPSGNELPRPNSSFSASILRKRIYVS